MKQEINHEPSGEPSWWTHEPGGETHEPKLGLNPRTCAILRPRSFSLCFSLSFTCAEQEGNRFLQTRVPLEIVSYSELELHSSLYKSKYKYRASYYSSVHPKPQKTQSHTHTVSRSNQMESEGSNISNNNENKQWRAEEAIAGNAEALQALRELITFPLYYSSQAKKLGLKVSTYIHYYY